MSVMLMRVFIVGKKGIHDLFIIVLSHVCFIDTKIYQFLSDFLKLAWVKMSKVTGIQTECVKMLGWVLNNTHFRVRNLN